MAEPPAKFLEKVGRLSAATKRVKDITEAIARNAPSEIIAAKAAELREIARENAGEIGSEIAGEYPRGEIVIDPRRVTVETVSKTASARIRQSEEVRSR